VLPNRPTFPTGFPRHPCFSGGEKNKNEIKKKKKFARFNEFL